MHGRVPQQTWGGAGGTSSRKNIEGGTGVVQAQTREAEEPTGFADGLSSVVCAAGW